MSLLQDLQETIEVSMNKKKADLLIHNIKVVHVTSQEVEEGSLVIHRGRIVAVNPTRSVDAEEVVDGGGCFVIPGLMDAHIHIDSTLLTPEAIAALIVPAGTTTLFIDPMEIANVAGIEGVKAFLAATESLPYRAFIEVPSRVPTAPGLETTGGVLGLAEVKELLALPQAVSLGEMDPAKIWGNQPEYLEKILAAQEAGKVANGHSIGLDWDQLNSYAAAGLSDDHECVTIEELQQRLQLGMGIMIREGSTERNLEALVKGLLQKKLPMDKIMFCTDDKHPDHIVEEGHINYNVNKAIQLGMPPMEAIRMATYNIARHFRLDHLLGSLTPGRYADFLLIEDLHKIDPVAVYKEGRLVAEKGQLCKPSMTGKYPDFLYHTVTISPTFSPESFRIMASGKDALVRVIGIHPEQIINEERHKRVPVRNGEAQIDAAQDILTLAVVERYGKNGNTGAAFVQGFGLKRGALASSVAHDHHNIVVVGTNHEDMYLAVKQLEKSQGGLVAVAEGNILELLPLPIAGLMSNEPASLVLEKLERVNRAAFELGCTLPAPFMTLSFISLPTVPELGLTDKGLIKVLAHETIPVVIG